MNPWAENGPPADLLGPPGSFPPVQLTQVLASAPLTWDLSATGCGPDPSSYSLCRNHQLRLLVNSVNSEHTEELRIEPNIEMNVFEEPATWSECFICSFFPYVLVLFPEPNCSLGAVAPVPSVHSTCVPLFKVLPRSHVPASPPGESPPPAVALTCVLQYPMPKPIPPLPRHLPDTPEKCEPRLCAF